MGEETFLQGTIKKKWSCLHGAPRSQLSTLCSPCLLLRGAVPGPGSHLNHRIRPRGQAPLPCASCLVLMTPGGPQTHLCPPAWASSGPFPTYRSVICVLFTTLIKASKQPIVQSCCGQSKRAIVAVPQGPGGMCTPHSPPCATAGPLGQLPAPTCPRQLPQARNLPSPMKPASPGKASGSSQEWPLVLLLQAEAQPSPIFPFPPQGVHDAVKSRAAGTSWPFCPFPWSMHIFSCSPNSLCTSAPAHLLLHMCSMPTTAQCTSALCTFPVLCLCVWCPPPREVSPWQEARGQKWQWQEAADHTPHWTLLQPPATPTDHTELPSHNLPSRGS